MRQAVAFILVRDGEFLAERRSASKVLDPGALAVPGGHVEEGEDLEDALVREMREELSVRPVTWELVSTQVHRVHRAAYDLEIHFFSVGEWRGEIEAGEADELLWMPIRQWGRLDLEADRAAMRDLVAIASTR
jgi:mutator protein MutT